MTLLPKGVKVHVALGITDMRKGLDGLAMLVQGTLQQDPFSGHLFAFRGRRADLIKIVFWDGSGLCLFTKRLEQRRFPWPARKSAGVSGETPARLREETPIGRLPPFAGRLQPARWRRAELRTQLLSMNALAA